MENTNIKEKFLHIQGGIYSKILIYIIFFIGAIYLSYGSYLIFHTIVEMFGITIGFVMLIISINTYKLNKDNKIIFLGIVFGFIAFINLIHLIAYKGASVSQVVTFNMFIQLWTLGRCLQSTSLLISFISKNKRFNLIKVLFIYLVTLVLSIIFIFYLNIFPDCYIDGFGFTSFKSTVGYINCGILLIVLLCLTKKGFSNSKKNNMALRLSIVANIICELCFLYSPVVDDLLSVLGHIFQLLSFYYIYIALVRSSLQEPHYSLIKLNNTLINKNERLISLLSKLELEYEERKRLENDKERKSQILNGILESVVDGILVINHDNRIIHVNNQFIKMLEIPFEITSETTSSEIMDFVKTQIKDPEEFTNHIESEWQTEEEYIQHIYLKNGKIFETSSVPFSDNSIVKGRVIICKDITEKRKIEELQKQIEIRQASLEKAREFDELKTNFFCTVSHELKTPINIILGVIQLASITKQGDLELINEFSSNKYIKIMKQNCYRLIKLSNNLIDITKIDAGYTEMNIKNHNIVSVIEDITLSVAEYVKSKDISLVFDTDIEEKIIACDNEQLERVMLNLLSNAIKFTDAKGKMEVTIKDKGDFIVISVKDSGIGIPEDKREIIFDRFRQVDSTLTRQKEGSGIGLALVKSIVEKHSGNISLKSEIGKGSEFIIKLPVKLVIDNDAIDEVSATKDMNVDRINIEFSDIYELNVY